MNSNSFTGCDYYGYPLKKPTYFDKVRQMTDNELEQNLEFYARLLNRKPSGTAIGLMAATEYFSKCSTLQAEKERREQRILSKLAQIAPINGYYEIKG